MERRRFPRYRCDFVGEIYDTDNVTLLGIGKIVNIGKNCAGLQTIVPFLVGQKFFVRFLDEKRKEIKVEVVVRRLELHGPSRYYGVEFLSVEEKSDKNLLEVIRQLESKQ